MVSRKEEVDKISCFEKIKDQHDRTKRSIQ